MGLAAGVRIGSYEILALVGAGGMGEVYRARDPRLGRDVAIKVLPAGFAGDPERLDRFEQEARAAAALNHPNILAVHDVGQHGPSAGSRHAAPYIVTELLEGETLRERLAGGPLPIRKAIEYAVQIAKGLAAAHDRGIVHRDLKPENVFVTADERLKILDFGLAKLTQPEPVFAGASALPTTPPNTLPGVVLGTVGYMAPEQVRGLTADHRSDIFALGAVLHEMLTGKRAFTGETAMDVLTAILKEDPPSLHVAERHIPPALERIAMRCLEKTPAARFKSADDLAFALEGVTTHSEPIAAVAGRVARPRRERVGWITSGVLVAAVAMLGFMLFRTRSVLPSQAPEMRLDVGAPPGASVTAFALSPDATRLAIVKDARLWLQPLDAEDGRALPGTEGASDGSGVPFWSPDGRAIGFFGANQLKRINLDTGLVQSLAEAPNPIGGSWSNDGVIVFVPSPSSPVMRVGSGGGGLTQATRLDPPRQIAHRFPAFLPDGRHFLYLAMGPGETRGIYIGSLDSPENHRLIEGDSRALLMPPNLIVFTKRGALLAQPLDLETLRLAGDPIPLAARVGITSGNFNLFGASPSAAGPFAYRANFGQKQLLWEDREGREITLVGEPDSAQPEFARLAPDGRTVAFNRIVDGNADVWLEDVDRGALRPLTFEPVRDASPIWSPDGTRVAYRTERTGVFDLYERAADGTGKETLLLASADAKQPYDWSRDGRFIVYALQASNTNRDLWILPTNGDRKPFAITQTPFEEREAMFSPDGQWIAYLSDETGRRQVVVQPFPGPGAKLQISTASALPATMPPQWRRDGREIFYLGLDNRVMAVPLSVSGSSLDAGPPVPLFTAPGGGIFVAAPDGQRFLVARTTKEAAPITLLLNWAGLRTRTD